VSAGVLYVVGTPLGNLGDLTARAADVLRSVHVVAAEDTRRTRGLLHHLDAHPDLVSFHAHSDPKKLTGLLEQLRGGRTVALVTDAGTPAISDPGAELVRGAHEAGIPVIPVPGPSAVITALSAAGLPADRFTFLGFPPRKGRDRRELLEAAASSRWTVVLYEAPTRLTALLADLTALCGPDRPAVVARELTKVHEEVRAGTLTDLMGYYEEHEPRGEVTLVLSGSPETPDVASPDPAAVRARALALRAEGLSRRDVVQRLVEELHLPRNEAYRLVTDA